MEAILLTQTGGILGPFAWILGKIFEGIYFICDTLFFRGNGSIGGIGIISVCIILFTLIVRFILLPGQIKQQKTMKLNTFIQPEVKAIQKKYENKKDQQSQMAMTQEINEVYKKYGTSPTGGCLQLLIQVPILFSLYRVIMNVPAYVEQVKSQYQVIISHLSTEQISKYFDIDVSSVGKLTEENTNTIIDIMSGSSRVQTDFNLADLVSSINNGAVTEAYEHIRSINQLFDFNLSDSPASMWAAIGVFALIIPILAGVTQFISAQLSMKMNSANNSMDDNPAMSSMKAMNYFMPLMSIWMCWSFASGIGLYWIAGSVVMIIQQIFIKQYFKKISLDDIIAENKEKAKKKREKKGIMENQITNAANIHTKSINSKASMNMSKEKEEKLAKARESYNQSVNKDRKSISSRANMVKEFNEKNRK